MTRKNEPLCVAVILLLLLAGVQSSSGQDLVKVDSLKTLLKRSHGLVRSQISRELVFEYADRDNGLALEYAQQACEAISGLAVDSLYFVRVNRLKAQILKRLERYQDAIESIQIPLNVARRNSYTEECEMLLNTLALGHFYLGHYDKSILIHLENLRIKELNGSADRIVSYNNIGLLYYKLEDYKRALEYFQKGIETINGDSALTTILYFNVALCYSCLKEHELALRYVQRGMAYCSGACEESTVMDGEFALGLIHYYKHNDSLAQFHIQRSYEIARDIGDYRRRAETLLYLGKLLNSNRDFYRSGPYLKNAVVNALHSRAKSLIWQSYFELSLSLAGQGRDRDAVDAWDKGRVFKDSLFDERIMNALLIAEVDFEQEKNKIRLARQESIADFQKQENFAISILGCLLFIVVGIMVFVFYERKRENEELERKVHERTRTLEKRVRTLERNEVERRAWEDKLDRAIHEGTTRLDVLTAMTGKQQLTDAVRILRTAEK